MIRNIKICFNFVIASLKTTMEYRIDCIVGMVSQLAYQIIELLFIWIIFQNTDNIAGWNFEQLLLLYGIMMLAIAVADLFFDETYGIGKRLIKNGKFDILLLRPVNPIISIIGESKATTALGYIALAVFLIVFMLIKLQIQITFLLVFKILWIGLMGGILIGGIQMIFAITGLWTYRSNEIVWSVFKMHRLAEYPIEIYNKFIRILITFIFPFALVAYYPSLEYLKIQTNYISIILPVVTIIIWIIAVKVWDFALKKYRSTGS